jgi:hypothetical protein
LRPTTQAGGVLFGLAASLAAAGLRAQDNYEIQVYGSQTVAPQHLMVELHSNYTFEGEKNVVDGVNPTDNALHETFEFTYGFTDWFETGFYVFTSARSGEGWQWVGDHIRPRIRAPDAWDWPVGVSLSTEIGYQRRSFSEDTWTWEIRPIIDKQWGPWYVSVNPALEKSLSGVNASSGFFFAPNAKISYDVTRQVSLGVEYYGSLGPGPAQHQIVPALDLNLSPDWELNMGAAIGLTHATDHFLVKLIVGRRFDFSKR